MSGMSETAACPPSPIANDHSPLPSSKSSLLQSVALACSLDASPYMPALLLYYCTFQGTLLEDLKCFFIFLWLLAFFFCITYKMYYEPITVQYYIADCVTWYEQAFTELTNWTYKQLSQKITRLFAGDLLYWEHSNRKEVSHTISLNSKNIGFHPL